MNTKFKMKWVDVMNRTDYAYGSNTERFLLAYQWLVKQASICPDRSVRESGLGLLSGHGMKVEYTQPLLRSWFDVPTVEIWLDELYRRFYRLFFPRYAGGFDEIFRERVGLYRDGYPDMRAEQIIYAPNTIAENGTLTRVMQSLMDCIGLELDTPNHIYPEANTVYSVQLQFLPELCVTMYYSYPPTHPDHGKYYWAKGVGVQVAGQTLSGVFMSAIDTIVGMTYNGVVGWKPPLAIPTIGEGGRYAQL
jgi:hypothetical protein